jgi:carbon-monoxide dehydrogenase catalytic subunit
MMGTDFSDILFGTPHPMETQANLGVLSKDMVNIVVHGHDPAMSEMVVITAEMPEFVNRARELGAKGINVVGICCTANEVAMRHGIPMVGNFLQQENAVLTGAVEVIVADVQCIFPASDRSANASIRSLSPPRQKREFPIRISLNLKPRAPRNPQEKSYP